MSKIDSLYGAHAATPFILRAAFSSVDEMIKAFKQGSQYTQVWYDEHCIIDTPNKNDKDNGIIYRRGYDYQNDMGGAIRIGQVVGPSSGTPYFSLNTMDDVTKISQRELAENEYRRFPISKNDDGTFNTAENGAIGKFEFGTSNALVPGKDSNGNFNDKIVYTWCNVRADNADADSWFYVGWEQPYLVEEFAVHDVSPYGTDGVRLADATTIKRIDDKSHPFYEQWNIGLPHGIKGDAMRNMRVIVPTEVNKDTKNGQPIYPYSALSVNSVTGVATIPASAQVYDGIDDDIKNQQPIIVFEYYTFDNNINSKPYLIYLGDFNVVKDISVAENGEITIRYTHQKDTIPDVRVRWVDSVSLNTSDTDKVNGGKFIVHYNDGRTNDFVAQLQWIKSISIDDDGTINYTYVGAPNVIESKRVKWVQSVTLDSNTGIFNINFNTNSDYQQYLQWVKDITIDEQTGTITLHYTGGTKSDLTAKLKLIVSASVNERGVVSFLTNTGETITLADKTDEEGVFHFKKVNQLRLSTALKDDKHLKVQYNIKDDWEDLGDPINFVQDMVVRPSDWHLLVLFNDPVHRDINSEANKQYTWVSGSELTNLNIKDSESLKSDIYWRDYGPIKDQAGILIGFNINDAKIATDAAANNTTYSDVLDYLNRTLPQGLTGDQNELGGMSTKGKIVAYTPAATEQMPKPGCEFYAFDYRYSDQGGQQWFYLGTIADDGSRDVGLANSVSEIQTVSSMVNNKGLVFVKDTFAVSTSSMPQFWLDSYES